MSHFYQLLRPLVWAFQHFALFSLLGMGSATAMDLIEVYQRALESDATWRAAQAEADAGRELLPQAESQLLPNLSLSGSYSRVQLDQERAGVTEEQRHYDSKKLTLNLTHPLINKPRDARLEQAEAQLRGLEANLLLQRGELVERVVTSYFSVLLADDVIEQLLLQKESNTAQLDAAKRAYELGQGTRTDMDEALARLDMVAVKLLQAQQQARYSRTELTALVGMQVETLEVLDQQQLIPESPKQSLEQLLEQAASASAQLRKAEADVEVAVKQVDEVRGERYPTLDLFLQKSYSESDSVNTVGSQYDTGQIGVQFNLPLYEGGRTSSRVRESEAKLQQAQAQQQQVLHQLQLQVRKEYQSVKETAARITALKQVMRSARQLVRSTRKGIVAGTRTTVDWLNARQQESDAIQQLYSSQYDYLLASIRLKKLTGVAIQQILDDVNRLLIPRDQKQIPLRDEMEQEDPQHKQVDVEV